MAARGTGAWTLAVVMVAATCIAIASAQEKPRLLFGHRGASVERPENTIEAFQRCIDLGCDVNELDLQRTLDNELVVFHDSTVDRTTNGTGPVATKTLAQLKALDAGYTFTPDGGQTYPYRGRGITIPTIAEAITQVSGGLFNIDMKTHDNTTAQLLANEITRLGAQARVIVGSFDDATVRAFREFAPGVSTLASLVECARFTVLFWQDRANEHIPESDFYEIPVGIARDLEGYHRDANALNQRVIYWTVNSVATMRSLLEAGADGIITDEVAAAVELYRELGYKP